MRLPSNGRVSNQANSARRLTTEPMRTSDGAFNPACCTAAGKSPSAAVTVRCRPVVAQWTAAAGVVAGLPFSISICDDVRQPSHAHVEDQRSGKARQGRPIEKAIGLVRFFVAGDEGHGADVLTMRQRDAGEAPAPSAAVTPGTTS